jgi:hypothetical protein
MGPRIGHISGTLLPDASVASSRLAKSLSVERTPRPGFAVGVCKPSLAVVCRA